MTTFFIFWVLGLIGAAAMIPYQFSMLKDKIEEDRLKNPQKKIPPTPVLKLISFVQTAVLLAISTYFGLKLSEKVGLEWPIVTSILEGTKIPFSIPAVLGMGILLALLAVLFIIIADMYFMKRMDKSKVNIPTRLQSFVASFYGGFSEEIITRLFVMSLVVYLTQFLGLETASYWIGIFFAAILFGVLHLPAAFGLFGKTKVVIVRTIILNTIPGILFGVLFWKFGIEVAMITHFFADIFLHVLIGPLFHKKLYS